MKVSFVSAAAAAVALLLTCTCAAVAVHASLASSAAANNRYFGAAIAGYHLSADTTYASILDAEFSSVTCENEMKWDAIEPLQNQFSFGGADAIFNHAVAHNMQVRGHTLVWYAQLPPWAKALPAAELSAAMNNHITRTMQHYAGRIPIWDVVNEAMEDDGTGLRRDSVFTQKLGAGFLEQAFRTARAADPTAKLCYNDYSIEGIWGKSNQVYNMVKDFKTRGVPIDCVGFQTHLGSVPADFQANLQRFANLGVDVQITELDIDGSGQSQANAYAAVVRACLAVSRCTGITVWGITDKYSWRAKENPGTVLLWDSNYVKKLAYNSVIATFDAAAASACAAPASPANGRFSCSGSTCTLSCNTGYAATGSGSSTCVNGAWTTLPTCAAVIISQCSAPAAPANGHFTCAGATCTLICDGGFAATGAGFSTCVNGVFSTLPSCVATGAGSMACALVSENNAMSLSCAAGQVLTAVEFASFGTPQGSCTASAISACHATSSLSVLQAACVGKPSCSVNAANAAFGDPCPGTSKQLAVRAHCAAASTVCASASERATLRVTCPAGTAITGISFASYGTPSTATCGSFSKSTCHAATSLDVVQKTCVGKSTCSFAAGQMNGVFGDPCSGTAKTLAVQALCA